MAAELEKLLFAPVELLLNRGIGQSSTAQAIAASLDGKSLDVNLDGVPFRMRIRMIGGKAEVRSAGDDAATATLGGPLLAMTRLLGGDPESLIRDGEIRMSGDSDVAQGFRDLLKMAKPDLEEELAKLVGDTAAHQVGTLARGITDWGRRAAQSFGRSVGEYLTEETRALPTRVEVNEFHTAVDTLAADIDRAEARLRRLQS